MSWVTTFDHPISLKTQEPPGGNIIKKGWAKKPNECWVYRKII